MTVDTNTIMDPARFFAYAQTHRSAWDQVVGAVVRHKADSFGDGTILRLEHTADPVPQLVVRFTSLTDEKTFQGEAFRDGFFTAVYVPQELIDLMEAEEEAARRRQEEQVKEQREEAEARARFVLLKRQYGLSEYRDPLPRSPLFAILLKLDANEDLDDVEQSWLGTEHLWIPLALHFEQHFRKNPEDCWPAVMSSKYWQDAGQPDRALRITEGITSTDLRCMAAILTSRGGAFRTKRNLTAAEEHGLRALAIQKDMYDCNLLGAVYFDLGDYKKGEHFFHDAESLGASPAQIENEMAGLLRASSVNARQSAAAYLFAKDPILYSWPGATSPSRSRQNDQRNSSDPGELITHNQDAHANRGTHTPKE